MLRITCLLIATGLASAVVWSDLYQLVLRVNDRIATTYDYQKRRNERVKNLQRSENLSVEARQELLSRVGEDTMIALFEELLILSRADQLRVEIQESAVDERIQQTKERLGTESEQQFLMALESWGMTLDDYREQIRRNMTMREVMGRDVQPRVQLEEEDLRRYYHSHSEQFQVPALLNLREIVVLESSGGSATDLSNLADEIRQDLAAGGKMEELTGEYAEQGLTSRPIDLGWVKIGDLDRELEQAVWKLDAGDISEPVSGRGGLHLLEVLEREEARLQSFSEVRDEIEAQERERRFQDEVQKFMAELEASSYIVAHPPPEAAGFRAASTLGEIDPLETLEASAEAAVAAEEGAPDPRPSAPDSETADDPPPPTPPSSPPPPSS